LTAEFLDRVARDALTWESAGGGGLRAGRDAFYALPPILREEALLLGTDRLAMTGKRAGTFWPDPCRKASRTPRRAAIRRFTGGDCRAADLGPLRVEEQDAFLTIATPPVPLGGEGFVLLIKEPGVYKLRGVTFKVEPCPENEPAARETGFYARLPLALRPREGDDRIEGRSGGSSSGYTFIITGEDSAGPAAFIGAGEGRAPIIRRRKRPEPGRGAGVFFFRVTAGDTGEPIGGTDAQRSK
jgi:tRNA(Ile)-lysidine synthase